MGNQIPDSHNQLSESTIETNEPIIESIVTDLVNAVHIKESMMSEVGPEPEQRAEDTEDFDKTSYFEANDSLSSPFDDCLDNFKTNETLVPNRQSTINDLMETTNIDEENDYSSKRSSSSSPVSEWKYSTYDSSDKDYSKPYQSVGSKYNEILDSWNLNKEDKKVKSRTSLMRNFDPLYGTECPSPPERRRAKNRVEKPFFFDEHNDSTGLIEDFAKCKIAETPKLESHVFVPQIINQKPDVLESAVQQQEINELKQRIIELETESTQKDVKVAEDVAEINQQLNREIKEKNESLNLIQKLHDINQILTHCSAQMLDDKIEIEKRSVERIKQLEDKCNHLMAENESLEKQLISSAKKDVDNEVITYKVQIKRLEMKIQSLETHLEQKIKETKELSSMVDDLIAEVHK